MKASTLVSALAAAAATFLLGQSAFAQGPAGRGPVYGAGSTLQPPAARYAPPAAPAQQRDPTQSWQYRAAERAAPIVRGTRDCAGGAVMGGVTGGAPGMAAGCVLGATRNTLFSSRQAY